MSRRQVLSYRFRRHGLHQPAGTVAPATLPLLDYGIQDTGPDGAPWALAVRGAGDVDWGALALAWTLRGAPHAYRRADVAAVAVATAPWSEADAAKRVFDAAKPLRAAGIAVLDALRLVAGHLRDIVTTPMPKGDVSRALTGVLDPPYLRECRSCGTTHIYEQPFRLAALQAGLELEPGTSPPVLRRVRGLHPLGYRRLADDADARLDVIANHLRFYGPARPADAAAFLDAATKDVRAHWPGDAVEVAVRDEPSPRGGGPRFTLRDDVEAILAAGDDERSICLLGPYDPYLQLRDRELLVADKVRRQALWPVLGRPGAVVGDGEVLGTWRPKSSGRQLAVRVDHWTKLSRAERRLLADEGELLAAHRGAAFAGLVED